MQSGPFNKYDELATAYYQLHERMDKVDKKDLSKKFKNRDDKDIDNDDDVDSSDKYLHKRRKAISKAVKKNEKVDTEPSMDDRDNGVNEAERTRTKGYNKDSVDKGIAASNRFGRKIGGKEAKNIHRLLKGRVSSGKTFRKDEMSKDDRKKLKNLDGVSIKDTRNIPHPVDLNKWEKLGLYTIDSNRGVFRLTKQGKNIAKEEFDNGVNEDQKEANYKLEKVRLPDGRTVWRKRKKDIKMENVELQEGQSSFSKSHLDKLRKEYSKIKRVDPSSESYKKMINLLDGLPKQALKQLATANPKINFLSLLAANRVRNEETQMENVDLTIRKAGNRWEIIDRKTLNVFESFGYDKKRMAEIRVRELREMGDDHYSYIAKDGKITWYPKKKKDGKKSLKDTHKRPADKNNYEETNSKYKKVYNKSMMDDDYDKMDKDDDDYKKKYDKKKSMKMNKNYKKKYDDDDVDEMSDVEMDKREDIVKSMKKNKDEYKKKYGNRWKEVMYATATKKAQKEGFDLAIDADDLMEAIELDELSKKKLGQYVKAASRDNAERAVDVDTARRRMRDADTKNSEAKYAAEKIRGQVKKNKRQRGIDKAVNRLRFSKEETENLDEYGLEGPVQGGPDYRQPSRRFWTTTVNKKHSHDINNLDARFVEDTHGHTHELRRYYEDGKTHVKVLPGGEDGHTHEAVFMDGDKVKSADKILNPVKEETEINEDTDFKSMKDDEIKKWLEKNDNGIPNKSSVFKAQIKAAKDEASKRNLKVVKEHTNARESYGDAMRQVADWKSKNEPVNEEQEVEKKTPAQLVAERYARI